MEWFSKLEVTKGMGKADKGFHAVWTKFEGKQGRTEGEAAKNNTPGQRVI
jgi:hypothetical protein